MTYSAEGLAKLKEYRFGYINAFKEISEKYDIPNDVSTVSLSRFPDVFTVHKAPEDEDQITADVLSAAKIAVDAFVAMT